MKLRIKRDVTSKRSIIVDETEKTRLKFRPIARRGRFKLLNVRLARVLRKIAEESVIATVGEGQ